MSQSCAVNGQSAFNQQSSGLWNRRLILRLLNGEGPRSRLQIAQRTGLQTSTVTYMVKDLVKYQMIRVAGKEESVGAGRKHMLLEVNSNYGWTVGVSLLQNDSAHLMVLDVANQIVDGAVIPLLSDRRILPVRLHEAIEIWLEKRGKPPGKMLGVGIGLPGIVDADTGMVLRSRRFSLERYPLAKMMRELIDAPVIVDRNAHLAAYAEWTSGCARQLPDFLFFMINRSIDRAGRAHLSYGTVLHLQGEAYRGAHFAAGELDPALAPDIDLSSAEADQVFKELAEEEEDLSPLVADFAFTLAKFLGPVANLLDPHAIVLGGDTRIRQTAFLTKLEDDLQECMIPINERRIPVLPSKMDSRAVAAGAGLRAVEEGLYRHEVGASTKESERREPG